VGILHIPTSEGVGGFAPRPTLILAYWLRLMPALLRVLVMMENGSSELEELEVEFVKYDERAEDSWLSSDELEELALPVPSVELLSVVPDVVPIW